MVEMKGDRDNGVGTQLTKMSVFVFKHSESLKRGNLMEIQSCLTDQQLSKISTTALASSSQTNPAKNLDRKTIGNRKGIDHKI